MILGITSFKFFARPLRDTFLFLVDVVAMKVKGVNGEKAYSRLLGSFFLFGGILNLRAAKLLGKPE